MSTHDSTMNRDSQAYWNKRAATFTRDATSDYEHWLLELLALEAGEEVLDMGCATGTLAVPLARAGHRIHGCDFAEAMLAILDERAADHPLSLSGGQKQRTCIASALASEREGIVYDEPTSGLDLHRMRQVARLIHDVRRRGAAQLVITHDPEFIMACCSWVVRLEDGGIMESYPLDAAGTRRLSGFFMHEGALDEKP